MMRPASICYCPLCRIERNLLAGLSDPREQELYRAFASSTESLSSFQDVPALIAHLRASQVDSQTDDILRDFLDALPTLPELVESFFVLAFVPLLHRMLRQIGAIQPSILIADVTQEALCLFLQVLHSEEFRLRRSHIAFALARAVKRKVFAWAEREGTVVGGEQGIFGDTLLVSEAELFEQHAVLRHFLHRCVSSGLLNNDELGLLLQFKLGEDRSENLGDLKGISGNALRQRAKRLLAKLRRAAQKPLNSVRSDGE